MYKALSYYTFKKTIKNFVAEWYTNKLDASERIHIMEVSGNRLVEKFPSLITGVTLIFAVTGFWLVTHGMICLLCPSKSGHRTRNCVWGSEISLWGHH